MRQNAACIAQIFLKAFGGFLALVDINKSTPTIDPNGGKRGAVRIYRPVPVVLVKDIGVAAITILGPAVEAADEIARIAAHAI